MSDIDLDALLLHRDFVRDLARSLLRDPHLAADVEQETWVAAIRSGPDDPDAARSWLATVVRNFARRHARTAGRRRARELAVAAREPTASTESLVEREQVRRRIVSAVLDLDEPFRSAVVFRYFEDLPPRQIARRTGVSVNTVRSRLRLAREKLRRRLDDEHGGDRSLWATPLLALLPGPTGVLLMTAKTKTLLLVAAAVLLAAVGAWRLSGPGQTPERPSGEGVPPTLADSARDPAGEESGEADANTDAPSTGRIHGRVPDGAGDRLVRVFLTMPGGDEVEAKPDADGGLEFPGLPAGGPYGVRAEAEGLAPSVCPGLVVRAGRATPAQLPEFEPAAALGVTVRSLEGRPIAGAAVAAVYPGHARRTRYGSGEPLAAPASHRAVTGTDGRAEFAALAATAWGIEVRAKGYARTVRAVRLNRGESRRDVEVRMEPANGLAGRVTLGSGEPVVRAVVLVTPIDRYTETDIRIAGLRIHRAGTDEQGAYRFADLPAGLFWIQAIAPDREESVRPEVLIPGPDRFDLVIESKGRGGVEGRVTDSDTGKPVDDVRIHIAGGYVRTDVDGRYRFEHLSAGPQRLGLFAEGYRAVSLPKLTVVADEVATVDLRLTRGARVVGRITSPGGPVAGAHVSVSLVGVPGKMGFNRGRSDSEGRYAVSGLEGGRYLVLAYAEGCYLSGGPTNVFTPSSAEERHVVTAEPEGETRHDISLGRAIVLEGRVADEKGRGLAGVTVEQDNWTVSPIRLRTTTDPTGRFSLPGVNPERGADLTLSRRGYRTDVSPVHVDVPETGDPVVLEMRAVSVVRGVVRSADGDPVPGARIEVISYGGPRGGLIETTGQLPATATCDDEGGYSADVPAVTGLFAVRATAPGYWYRTSGRVRIEDGTPEYEVDLVLDVTHSVSGRVVAAEGGEGVAGAVVRARWGQGNWIPAGPIAAVADREGRFRVSGLQSGKNEIGAEAEGFARTSPLVVTLPGADDVRIVLAPARPIAGILVGDDGSPIENAAVAALPVGSAPSIYKPWSVYTAADGSFRIDGLAPGEYRLEITGADIPPTTVERVEAGTESLRVVAESGGEIAGRIVDEQGREIAGCKVNARPTKQMSDISRWKNAEADSEGRFRIVGLDEDLYTVYVSPPVLEMSAAYVYANRADVAPGTTDLKFVLERTWRIAGTVRDESGKPVGIGSVMLTRADGEPGGAGIGLTADGRFSVGGLRKGKFRLSHRAPDAGEDLFLRSPTEVSTGMTGVEVVAVPGASLTGRVEDADGKPVAGARVGASPPGPRDDRVTLSKADGTFRIQGLAPGSVWRLWANTNDGRGFAQNDVVAGESLIRIVLR